jgi:alpha-1,2-mannosyltransferase
VSSPVPRGGTAPVASIPGLRTFESRRFRLLVAALFVLLGFALNIARLTVYDPADPGLAFDFAAYYHAAERMLAGASPYTAAQLEASGAGLCFDCYLYPPFFAQVLSPITLVPLAVAKVIWLVLSYLAAFVSTWLATGIGGAARSLERALWCLAVVLLFDAVGSAAWNGNVGAFVALGVTLVAVGGVAAGVGGGLSMLLKVAPATLLPAVFVADRESRTALLATLRSCQLITDTV